jgi:hypothetical protein
LKLCGKSLSMVYRIRPDSRYPGLTYVGFPGIFMERRPWRKPLFSSSWHVEAKMHRWYTPLERRLTANFGSPRRAKIGSYAAGRNTAIELNLQTIFMGWSDLTDKRR